MISNKQKRKTETQKKIARASLNPVHKSSQSGKIYYKMQTIFEKRTA